MGVHIRYHRGWKLSQKLSSRAPLGTEWSPVNTILPLSQVLLFFVHLCISALLRKWIIFCNSGYRVWLASLNTVILVVQSFSAKLLIAPRNWRLWVKAHPIPAFLLREHPEEIGGEAWLWTLYLGFPQRLLLESSRPTGLCLKYPIGIKGSSIEDSFLGSHRTDLVKPEATRARSLFAYKWKEDFSTSTV